MIGEAKLFADYVIICVRILNKFQKMLELLSEYNKILEIKVNVQKLIVLIYIGSKLWGSKIRNSFVFIIILKIKYLMVSLTKDVYNLISESLEPCYEKLKMI
jgi:hypothetical protein